MFLLIKHIYGILTDEERKQSYFLLLAIVAMGFFEALGIASIMPFMQLAADPASLSKHRYLYEVYEYFNFTDTKSFLFAIGACVLVLLTVSNLVSVSSKWVQYRFAWRCAHSLATRLLGDYVQQPYEFFLQRNTNELSKQVLAEVTNFVRMVLVPATQVAAQTLVSFVIFLLLVIANPMLALVVLIVLGGAYLAIYGSVRKYLTKIGLIRFSAVEQRFKTAAELLNNIKMVKIRGTEQFFNQRFTRAMRVYSSVQPKYEVIAQSPKYFIEIVAFGGVVVIVMMLLGDDRALQDVIPLLSLYALAGYRLLPSLQSVFKEASTIRFNRQVADSLYEDLHKQKKTIQPMSLAPVKEAIPFEHEIRVKDVSYAYPSSGEYVIDNLNLTIPKGDSVAFVGATGSGKTTMVDIIVGLLEPTSGSILVDGRPITLDNVRQWRKIIGYVPQDVVLYDDTIIRNIVFGIPDDQVDMDRIRKVAAMACIDTFIETELPKGYETVVGERGNRLSGGQRQRIGLARALYHRPSVLILDEATSALDGLTEDAVMKAISQSDERITLIMIAHRLATVRHCDTIFLFENGKIASQGNYDSLIESSSMFRGMARLAS